MPPVADGKRFFAGELLEDAPARCPQNNCGYRIEPSSHPVPLPIRWGEGDRRSGEGLAAMHFVGSRVRMRPLLDLNGDGVNN